MIAAKARCKLIAVVAANAKRRVGKHLQRREDQRLVALACLIAELRLGEPEDVDNVGARRVGIRYCGMLSVSLARGGWPPGSSPRGTALDLLRSPE